MHTKVSSLMKINPEIIDPNTTLKEAARKMSKLNCGVLPVGDYEELVGMITDRDIVICAIAGGKNVAREKVKDYMSPDVFYCSKDDTLETAPGSCMTSMLAALSSRTRRAISAESCRSAVSCATIRANQK